MPKRIKWTAEMEAKLMHMRDGRASLDTIADALNVSRYVVWKKCKELYSLMAKHEKPPKPAEMDFR